MQVSDITSLFLHHISHSLQLSYVDRIYIGSTGSYVSDLASSIVITHRHYTVVTFNSSFDVFFVLVVSNAQCVYFISCYLCTFTSSSYGSCIDSTTRSFREAAQRYTVSGIGFGNDTQSHTTVSTSHGSSTTDRYTTMGVQYVSSTADSDTLVRRGNGSLVTHTYCILSSAGNRTFMTDQGNRLRYFQSVIRTNDGQTFVIQSSIFTSQSTTSLLSQLYFTSQVVFRVASDLDITTNYHSRFSAYCFGIVVETNSNRLTALCGIVATDSDTTQQTFSLYTTCIGATSTDISNSHCSTISFNSTTVNIILSPTQSSCTVYSVVVTDSVFQRRFQVSRFTSSSQSVHATEVYPLRRIDFSSSCGTGSCKHTQSSQCFSYSAAVAFSQLRCCYGITLCIAFGFVYFIHFVLSFNKVKKRYYLI